LARELLAGTWPPGTVLPTGKALAQQWGMNVGSLRAPLAALVEAGILTRTGYGQYRVNGAAEFRAVQLQVAS
jgi:DNA-binding GntR family transcriptional regulator